MSHELHYTSLPRGLKPGSRGFCTVATTPNLSRPLAERLESLSGYQPVYPPGDPAAAQNPVVRAHVKVSIGSRPVHVLSRIGPAGLDYSSRPNKYAHHVVLEPAELPSAGPAWLLGQPGFLETAWLGEPRVLPAGRVPPAGDRAPGVASTWQARTGDAGWAGVLAEAFLADPRRPAYLVFRPGTELLPLFEEAIALLPASRRWDVEFSTYFTQLPQGISCSWRGVLDGSELALQAARIPGSLVIDLAGAMGRAQGGALVQLARTGEPADLPGAFGGVHAPTGPSLDMIPPLPTARSSRNAPERAPSIGTDLIPEMAALLKPARSRASLPRAAQPRSRGLPVGVLITGAFVAALLAVGAFFFGKTNDEPAPAPKNVAHKGDDRQSSVAEISLAKSLEQLKAKATMNQTRAAIPKQDRSPFSQSVEEPSSVVLGTRPAFADVPAPTRRTPTPAAGTPLPPTPKSPDAPAKEPIARLFPIPQNPVSGLGSVRSSERLLPFDKEIRSVEFLAASDNHLDVRRTGEGEFTIRTKSSSVTYDPVEVAKLKFGRRELAFDWGKNLQDESETVLQVLDALIRIGYEDGAVQYVLLRPIVRDEPDALVLRGIAGKGPKLRWTTKWAEGVGLQSTKQKFLLRRWRVESNPRDEHGSLMVESTAASLPTANDEHPVIKDELSLKIRLDDKDPGEIHVRIETSPRFKDSLAGLEKRIDEIEDDHLLRSRFPSRSLAARALEVKRFLADRLTDAEEKSPSDEQRAKIRQTEQEISEIDRLLKTARIYSLVDELGYSDSTLELSAIVCLKLRNGIVIDVARFGDFATPDKKPGAE
jgi:hypothetical protein